MTRRKPDVSTVTRRSSAVAALACALVVALAVPASATTVVADDDFKWFYWVGPVLVLSLIGLVIAIGIGYYVRVLRPKWRGRPSS